jgi:NAD+--asparagine ADP-ribosyltransferase
MMAFIEKTKKYTQKENFKSSKLFKDDKIDLINRIELIEAQIENVKHSGHFTERNRHKYIH